MATLDEVIAAMQATAGGKITPVQVDGWPLLYVRKPLVEEVELADEDTAAEGKPDKRTLARGAARVLCHDNGLRMFDPRNEDHLSLLGRQPWDMLQKVLAAAEGKAGN